MPEDGELSRSGRLSQTLSVTAGGGGLCGGYHCDSGFKPEEAIWARGRGDCPASSGIDSLLAM